MNARLLLIVTLACFLFLPAAYAENGWRTMVERELVQENHLGAERMLRTRLKRHGDDNEARFMLARVLSWQKKNGDAMAEYDRLLASEPENADYLLGKGQTLFWSGRGAEALPLLERARALVPEYEQVWQLELKVLQSLSEERYREKAVALSREAAEKFPDTAWPQTATPKKEPETTPHEMVVAAGDLEKATGDDLEIELGFVHETLSKGFADWRTLYAEFAKKTGQSVVYGMVQETERFDITDTQYLAGFYHGLAPGLTLLVEGDSSPTHNILHRWSLLGQLLYSLGNGYGIEAGYRHKEYTNTRASLGIFAIERYWSRFHAAYTFYPGDVQNAGSSTSNSVQFNYFYSEPNRIGVIYSFGEEVENIGNDRVLKSTIRTFVLRGRHWLAPDWAVTYEYSNHEQGDSYTKNGIKVGLRYAF